MLRLFWKPRYVPQSCAALRWHSSDTWLTFSWNQLPISVSLNQKGIAAWISYEAWMATGKLENYKDSTWNFILTEQSGLLKKTMQTTHIQTPVKFAFSSVKFLLTCLNIFSTLWVELCMTEIQITIIKPERIIIICVSLPYWRQCFIYN